MQIIKQHDFIEEISTTLCKVIDDTKITYSFNTPLASSYSLFDEQCLLPLFLYNKQLFIDKFCEEHLKGYSFEFYYDIVDESQSPMRVSMEAKYDFIYEEDYIKIFKFITNLVFIEINHYLKDNNLEISPLYENCMESFLVPLYKYYGSKS